MTKERWLQEEVGPAYDAMQADETRGISVDAVRARLAAEHKAESVEIIKSMSE